MKGICSVCKREKTVQKRRDTGAITCRTCDDKEHPSPKEVCVKCPKGTPARVVHAREADGNPHCYSCYVKYLQLKQICIACKRKMQVKCWLPDGPVCQNCNRQIKSGI